MSVSRTSDSANSRQKAEKLLADRFRCPLHLANFPLAGTLSPTSGYFQFSPGVICYGQCASGTPAQRVTDPLHDARRYVTLNGAHSVPLPFDPLQIIDNLRCERYLADSPGDEQPLPANRFFRNAYYLLRPLLPVPVRKHLQQLYFRSRDTIPFPKWPVDRTVESVFDQLLIFAMKAGKISRMPFIWFWPEGAPSCTMLTHDVETAAGVEFCRQLMDLNDSFAVKSSFQIVPELRYPIPDSFLPSIRERGFEINIHDLNHDGHLFTNRKQFLKRAERINRYARQYGALGFRSAVMYRNIDWYDALDLDYDMSIPNVAHFDPQQGGCCTVMPFFIGRILELPVTTTQDYTLFHILNDYSTRLWKEQIARIRNAHGLMSFLIHPDYIIDEAARRVYTELLQYLTELRAEGETWIALPREVAGWWRLRSEMELVQEGNSWRIQGKGSERARLAYAVLDHDRLIYEFR
ncbi:MAG: hypothetical protein IT165_19510 [Bryobacterales bacterium]|nr:hypothetical protein [Bryobacterales bacterium]